MQRIKDAVIYALVALIMISAYPFFMLWEWLSRLANPHPQTFPSEGAPRPIIRYRSQPLRPIGEPVPYRMNKGVGYCENIKCGEFSKSVFLLNHGPEFFCQKCRAPGLCMEERGFYTGTADIFNEVRVEHNFDSLQKRYRSIAIVNDDSLAGICNTYTLQSPLIQTENRALKVAEALLSNLNRYRGNLIEGEIPLTHEQTLSFDDDLSVFTRQCRKLKEDLEQSDLVLAKHSSSAAERN